MTRPPLLLAPLALALALAAPAGAQADDEADVWDDPTLVDAVRQADLVVLGQCTAVGRGGGAAYKVVRTLKGAPRDGREVLITRMELDHDHPDTAAVESGDRAYFVLQGDPQGHVFSQPTRTFGRFPLVDFGQEPNVVAALSSTFVRIAIPQTQWERILQGIIDGAPPAGLLDEARAALTRADADVTAVYVGLEVLTLFGGPADTAAVVRAAKDERFQGPRQFQVRVAAARALGHFGGPGVVAPLLDLVEQDKVDVVQSVAAGALGPVLQPLAADGRAEADVRGACERLARFALGASSQRIRFAAATDPRKNEVEGPLSAALATLSQVRARAGVAAALRALERSEEIGAVVAGLAYFSALGDKGQALAIATRMRQPGAEDLVYNRLFARTLEDLTGQHLGEDREAWLRWCRAQALTGPDSPLGPPAPPPTPPGGGPGR